MKTIINILKEEIKYRDQIFRLAQIDLKKTYRECAIGWAWAIIRPTITILVYWITFTFGLRVGKDVNGYSYFLWIVTGIIPWFYMNDMLVAGTESIYNYRNLVTKTKFPLSGIPIFVSISKFIVFLILITISIVIFILFGHFIDLYIFQIIFYALLMFMFFTTFGITASLLGAISRDFSAFIRSMITPIFWVSGILWNTDNITNFWGKLFFKLNPITFFVNGFRDCFIYKIPIWKKGEELAIFAIIFILLIFITAWIYKKLRKEVPDVL